MTAHRPAFTLLETVLAAIMGSVVLFAAVAVFAAADRAESAFAARFEDAAELNRLQLATRRVCLTFVMGERAAAAPQGEDAAAAAEDTTLPSDAPYPADARPRILLETDRSPDLTAAMRALGVPAGTPLPQRLEVVVRGSPLPELLAGPAAAWADNTAEDSSLAFRFAAAADGFGSGGTVRGVFELRPDGAREAVMRAAGLGRRDWPAATTPPEWTGGWTLWWRPMPAEEVALRATGVQPNLNNTADEIVARSLAAAIPVARGLTSCRWQVFKDSQRQPLYAAATTTDLPSYFELEVETLRRMYANWMFEIAWNTGPDPTAPPEDEPADGEDDDEADEAGGDRLGPGGAGEGVGRGRAGPGGGRPRPGRTFDRGPTPRGGPGGSPVPPSGGGRP